MKVKAIEKFRDLKEDKVREKGEIFEVSKERYNTLILKGPFIELIIEKGVTINE